jgi:hypothetical protein
MDQSHNYIVSIVIYLTKHAYFLMVKKIGLLIKTFTEVFVKFDLWLYRVPDIIITD